MTAAATGPLPLLQLYRGILRAAKHFPSRKRDRIIAEIKHEFHANKDLQDPVKLQHCLAIAKRGLSDLESYLPAANADNGNTSVTLKGMTE